MYPVEYFNSKLYDKPEEFNPYRHEKITNEQKKALIPFGN
jgi:hypothetical protein